MYNVSLVILIHTNYNQSFFFRNTEYILRLQHLRKVDTWECCFWVFISSPSLLLSACPAIVHSSVRVYSSYLQGELPRTRRLTQIITSNIAFCGTYCCVYMYLFSCRISTKTVQGLGFAGCSSLQMLFLSIHKVNTDKLGHLTYILKPFLQGRSSS